MKLTIERGALLKSLQDVQGVVERRTTIPILSNVLLDAAEGALSVTATDMDLAIVERIPCTVSAGGATTVAAHTLYDLVRKLPEGAEIEVDSDGAQNQLVVRCGRSRLALTTLPSEDFPAGVVDGELPHGFRLRAADLRAVIDRTRFAMSSEETRYYLNGIYMHPAESESGPVLRIVATDGHRLARVEMPQPEGASGMPGIIVPRKTVGEMRKLVDEDAEDVVLALSDTRLSATFGGTVLTSKLIDGTYPDYDRVIPFGNDKTLKVAPGTFAKAVDLVSTIASESTRAVKLRLDQGLLVLSASSPEAGDAEEQIEVDYADGPLEIGFNARYLLDIAALMDDAGDGAQFLFSDGASSALVRDLDDPASVYVLMPMRV